eukprot:1440748-Rhodomonas_salina.1
MYGVELECVLLATQYADAGLECARYAMSDIELGCACSGVVEEHAGAALCVQQVNPERQRHKRT